MSACLPCPPQARLADLGEKKRAAAAELEAAAAAATQRAQQEAAAAELQAERDAEAAERDEADAEMAARCCRLRRPVHQGVARETVESEFRRRECAAHAAGQLGAPERARVDCVRERERGRPSGGWLTRDLVSPPPPSRLSQARYRKYVPAGGVGRAGPASLSSLAPDLPPKEPPEVSRPVLVTDAPLGAGRGGGKRKAEGGGGGRKGGPSYAKERRR